MRRLLWVCAALPVLLADAASAFEADRNKDGFVTYEELANYYYGYLTQLDYDRDLALAVPEVSGLYGSFVENGAFAKSDLDSDGLLKGDERSAFARAIAAGDLEYCDRDYDYAIGVNEEEACF